ncbi:MAG: DUF1491 family protein [Alphaproteobacteria bacterium]|jgi:hypothetical protein|nr:DUF1491 family protein [Alphaproteobacteria bacterium]
MTDDRLPTELWVSAGLHRCSLEAVPAVVIRKGERQSGTVILKLDRRDRGTVILTQSRNMDGKLVWFPANDGKPFTDAEAAAYVDRAVSRDPDIWVIEIEHQEGWHPFTDI